MTQTFQHFQLSKPLPDNIAKLDFAEPTPIQQLVIPKAATGSDIYAQAKTGTGKTAAYGLPILDAMLPDAFSFIRALIIVPTRELAFQVNEMLEAFAAGSELKGQVIVGGEQDLAVQEHRLRQGTDWVIATPGRLLDHLNRQYVDLTHLQFLVLDDVVAPIYIRQRVDAPAWFRDHPRKGAFRDFAPR